jgi:hypothetical protein
MVKCLISLLGCLNKYLEVLNHFILPTKFTEANGPKGSLGFLINGELSFGSWVEILIHFPNVEIDGCTISVINTKIYIV